MARCSQSYVALVFVASSPWQVLSCSVSLAFAMAGVAFSIQHDGNHGAYAERAIVNRLTGVTLDALGGKLLRVAVPAQRRVCHVHYPRIARIVKETCAEFGVRYTVHRSCLGAVRSHFRWLRRMGQAK